jgi:hypothetical protein
MKNFLDGDWSQKLITSRAAIWGLSVSGVITVVTAFEAGKYAERTKRVLDENCQQTGPYTPAPNLNPELKFLEPGVELAFPGTELNISGDRLKLHKGNEYNFNRDNGKSFTISENLQPVRTSCDQVCREARKAILSCFGPDGCDIGELKTAVEKISHYPHGQKI